MILATIAAALCFSTPFVNEDPIKCAVMGNPTKATSIVIEYAGSQFPICCGGCASPLSKEPAKYLKAAIESGNTIARFMFCPVTGEKLDLAKTKDTVDYKGVRYSFCNADCKAIFTKDSAKFVETPAKESLVCPKSGEQIAAYSEAAGFMDYKGVRYYACCGDCLVALKKDADGIISQGKAKVTEPVAKPAPKPKKDGN